MTQDVKAEVPENLFTGGGEMGALMRSLDWSQTPLGPVSGWAQSLKTAVSICLNSRFPMVIWWGRELVLLYNDAWRPILGTKHPKALGRPGQEVWLEIWDIIGTQLNSVLTTGQATWSDDFLLLVDRYSYIEEAYFTYSYSPIFLETGEVGGAFTAVTETTQRVIGERRLSALRELSANAVGAKNVEETCRIACETLVKNPYDIPFALLYLVEDNGKQARLVGTAGIEAESFASASPRGIFSPQWVDLTIETEGWNLAHVKTTYQTQLIDGLNTRFGSIPRGAWEDPPHSALVMPIAQSGQEQQLAGLLVVGISPRRELDDNYRGFFDLVANQVATAIANANAYEAERRRAEALAELDRAKTTFFNNVSHEFRTPLTLMLNPLEDALASLDQQENRVTSGRVDEWEGGRVDENPSPHPPIHPSTLKKQLQVAYRNSQRLLKLVNTLLDFSRIEAGRIEVVYEPTDLAMLTTDLAGVFRSAIDRAGMCLRVDCPPLPEPVYVDREMWEKIVLNLLSNAFKFTFEGEIAVVLRSGDDHIELVVQDTGTGIPAEELSHIFERFHQVKGARGRSYEGSGIGLSLVQELVRLHGGTIQVSSVVDQGTSFIVSIPTGFAHLPSERLRQGIACSPQEIAQRIGATRTLVSTATGAASYLEELLRWLPKSIESSGARVSELLLSVPVQPKPSSAPTMRILLADDNADMRDYLKRLLSQQYEVEAVADGVATLAAIRQQMPDLLLTDVMMPGLDGFELLRSLRTDPQTKELPIILLSARAGEESRIEGLEAGADDYLTKPFSARELLARIEATLKLAQMRQEATQREREMRSEVEAAYNQVNQILESMTDAFVALDQDWQIVYLNAAAERINGKLRTEVLGKTHWEEWPASVGTNVEHQYRRAMAEQISVHFEHHYYAPFLYDIWLDIYAYPFETGLGIFFRDITERKQAEEILRQSEARFQRLAANLPGVIYQYVLHPDGSDALTYVSPKCREIYELEPEVLLQDFGQVWAMIHPDDVERVHYANTTSTQRLESFDVKFRLIVPSGRLKWIQAISQPERQSNGDVIFDGLVMDITAHKQAEDRLRESEERFRTLADNIAQFAWIADETGWIFWYNRRWFDYTGTTLEEMEGWGWQKVHHPEHVDRVVGHIRHCFATGETWEDTFPLRGKDGQYRWFLSRAIPIRDEQGRVLRWFGTNTDITDRKRTEEALRESEERLRVAQSAAKSGTWDWDVVAGSVYWSEEYYILYGLDPTTPSSYENWLATVLEEDRESADRTVREALQQRQTALNFEFRIRHPLQGVRWFASLSQLFYDSGGQPKRAIGISIDITDRKQAEEALRQSEERYRYLAESISQLVWTANAEGHNEYVNQQMCRYTGLTFEQLMGFDWQEIIHPEDLDLANQMWQEAVQSRTPFDTEYRLRRADGVYRWFIVRAIPIKDESDRIVKWFGTCTDIHEQKELAVERTRLLQEEQAAREAAEVANRIKDEFLAVVSHELRSPLNPILGWSKLLRSRQLDEQKTERALEIIERNAQMQAQLINDLLDVSRILRGKLSLDARSVNLVSTIQSAMETVRLAAEAKSIQIHTLFDPEVGHVSGDPGRLQQVVWNLLSNAVKFTPQGGRVDIRLERVEQRNGGEGGDRGDSSSPSSSFYAQITVTDTGKGIHPDFLPHVFDHFRQEDAATTRRFGGLGLGLAIVRYLVELHGGTVWADSLGDGQGAIFSVRLPLMPHQPMTNRDTKPSEPPLDLNGIGILVVDDDDSTREFIAFLLELHGARVVATASAGEAIATLAQFKPDVLLSDIGMPDVDGYMLIRQVRTLPPEQGGQIPAIALTAYAGEIDYQQAIAAGFQKHIPKPVEPETLVKAIASVVEQKV